MKTLNGKRDKPGSKTQAEKAPEIHSDISDLSAESLETPVETENSETASEAKPEKVKTPEKIKLTDQDKSRAMGIAATIVCVGGLAIFVIYQMLTGGSTPGKTDNQNPENSQIEINIPGQIGADGQLEFNVSGDNGSTSDTGANPFNRGQWDDYKLETEDGDQAADQRGSQVEGGTRYWVRGRDGNNEFKIIIPAGYVAGDLGDCITVGTGNYDTTGSEPITFFWRNDTQVRILLNKGYYDIKNGANGYDQYDIRALGYYLFEDSDGETWPVVTAVMTRDETNPDIETYSEYWIVVGRPASDGRYLVGTIPAESFADIQSQLYPNISAFAMGLFPAESVPDFPSQWEIPSLNSTTPEQNAEPDASEDPTISGAPDNTDGSAVPEY